MVRCAQLTLGNCWLFVLLQRQVVPQLSCLFASLLADQTWLIHQHALEAFTHFAEVSRAQLWVQAFGSVNFCCTQILLTQMFAAPHCPVWIWVTHWKCWGLVQEIGGRDFRSWKWRRIGHCLLRLVTKHLFCSLVSMNVLNHQWHFWQETRHEDVVPWCLNSEEAKNKVVNFLAKVCVLFNHFTAILVDAVQHQLCIAAISSTQHGSNLDYLHDH